MRDTMCPMDARMRVLSVFTLSLASCYSGSQTTPDINRSWQHHSAGEIRTRWGAPTQVAAEASGSVHVWSIKHRHYELPTLRAELNVGPNGLDAYGEARAGKTWTTTTDVLVHVDAANMITSVEGPSLRWGPPNDANLRWGTIFGMHVGMGRLDDTATPLPSGGLYIGGMLSKTVGLVGSYSLTSGSDDAGGAMGMAWSLGAQWWPQMRIGLRVGPAMVLAFDPGFENVGLEPGINGSASYVLIRSGTFTLDMRMDITAGTSTRFANLGIGVNLN